MKIIIGLFLMLLGVVFIIISIMGLVKAFDVFSNTDSSIKSIGYTFGSIVFPLLMTVIGRWLFRRGLKYFKGQKVRKDS